VIRVELLTAPGWVKCGVTATPAIAINGRLELSGVPREDALRARLRAAAEAGARR
jgi:protein-disulfide isomerase